MNDMERYFLIATGASIVFYAIYHFFLRKESCHQFNRFYLLSALVISLLIPFVRFSVAVPMTTNAATPVSNFSEFITYMQLPQFTVVASTPSEWNMAHLFLGIYICGLLVFSILFFIKIIKIGSVIIQSKRNREGKFIFVEYEKSPSPFSFFNFIFMNKDAYNKEDRERVILHEQIHVQKRHSLDLIFVELLGILFWFNPILLLYKRSLQIIHEYMADHCVLQQGIEQVDYLNLLLRQLTVPNEWMLGHHFNYLLTKNRFIMLKNHHYSKWALAKSVYVAPFIVLLLMLNCKHNPPVTEPVSKENISVIVNGEVATVTTIENVPIEETELENNEPPLRFVEQLPEYPGGQEAMVKFLQENLKFPETARKEGISGQVFYEFVVEKDGSVKNVKVLSGVHPDLDAEGMRVLKLMPNWKPGKQSGAPVRCYYHIPVRFTIN